jgi:hypothetical protein
MTGPFTSENGRVGWSEIAPDERKAFPEAFLA